MTSNDVELANSVSSNDNQSKTIEPPTTLDDGTVNRAKRLLDELEKQVTNSLTLVDAIENAKDQAEQLATKVNGENAAILTTIDGFTELMNKSKADAENLKLISESIKQIATSSETAKVQIEQNAQVANTRSQHVEEGRQYIDARRAEVDRILTEAKLAHASIDGVEKSSRTTLENIATLNATAQTTKGTIDETNKAVSSILDEAKKNCEVTKQLADASATTESRITSYEESLRSIKERAEEQLQRITDLLPGATSAGLASAFQARRRSFWIPQLFWQGLFLASLGGIITFAIIEFNVIFQSGSEFTLERIGIGLLRRLPMLVPLVWLAIHSTHKAALAQRVEEDYGFKETVSRSFEGYRKEMVALEATSGENSAVRELCSGVLKTITDRPGRIYDRHPLVHTPTTELVALSPVIGQIVAQVVKQIKPFGTEK